MASSSKRALTHGGTCTSYLSSSGLSSVLKEIRDHGMPKRIDRKAIKRAREEVLPPEVFTTVSLLMTDKSEKDFPAVHPVRQLQHAASTIPAFANFLASKLELHANDRSRPFKLCLYSDEVTPGNPLVANERKLVCFYFSFVEFDGALGSALAPFGFI